MSQSLEHLMTFDVIPLVRTARVFTARFAPTLARATARWAARG